MHVVPITMNKGCELKTSKIKASKHEEIITISKQTFSLLVDMLRAQVALLFKKENK